MKYLATDTGQFYDNLDELEEIQSGLNQTFYVSKKYCEKKMAEDKEKNLNTSEVKI